jgi:hypothetical protein
MKELTAPAPPGKVYRGRRDAAGVDVTVQFQDRHGATRLRPLRLVQPRHSPTGFSWGYEGSGCAELARQLLRDVFGSEALDQPWLYQRFKRAYVAHWGDTWVIGEDAIRQWVRSLEGGLERACRLGKVTP